METYTSSTNHPAAAKAAAQQFQFVDRAFEGGCTPEEHPVWLRNDDGQLDWLHDAIREAHAYPGGDYHLPNDWTYYQAERAMDYILELDLDYLVDSDAQELAYTCAQRTMPLATCVLATWMSSRADRVEAVAEIVEQDTSLHDALAAAYADEAAATFHAVHQAYLAHLGLAQ